MTHSPTLHPLIKSVQRIARQRGHAIDRLRIQALPPALFEDDKATWQKRARDVCDALGLKNPQWLQAPDAAFLPLLTHDEAHGWCVLVKAVPGLGWQAVAADGAKFVLAGDAPLSCARLLFGEDRPKSTSRMAYAAIKESFLKHRGVFAEAALATVMINLVALATSLYSMQVYDRVIPSQGYSTLSMLTLGVMIAMTMEWAAKLARSHLMERVVVQMDGDLSRQIFERLLAIRLDQFPGTVGSLSSQLRGYESIRSFLSASTLYLLVDVPFALVFLLLIALIGHPLLAVVPLLFLGVSLLNGLHLRRQVDAHAGEGAAATNLKTGLLVEAVEGAETVKASSGGWWFLSRWMDVTRKAIHHDTKIRNISEHGTYLTAFLQQVSYVGLVALGAWLVTKGDMTMGSLIACSIISGRALAPVGMIPGMLVQRAHAKAALEGLERVYELRGDNHDIQRPLAPEVIRGHYRLKAVKFAYAGNPVALAIEQLEIRPGQKVGVLGPIGSGKSTLLRVLAGLYKPTEGTVLLDDLDIGHLHRHTLSENIGYLQQDARLIMGTLRENLLVGLVDPGDEAIHQAARTSGLMPLISAHPKGLDLTISEGGRGLSGGQRQLVGFTRLLLSRPHVWLLDEPTASMDEPTERQAIAALRSAIRPDDTVLIVTHKPSMLPLVDYLIVVTNHGIAMAGPRDEVLKRLQDGGRAQLPAQPSNA